VHSSIPRPRPNRSRKHIKSTSLRALAVAARLERHHEKEAPPGVERRAERRRSEPTTETA